MLMATRNRIGQLFDVSVLLVGLPHFRPLELVVELLRDHKGLHSHIQMAPKLRLSLAFASVGHFDVRCCLCPLMQSSSQPFFLL
jgi:hypothetical protein